MQRQKVPQTICLAEPRNCNCDRIIWADYMENQYSVREMVTHVSKQHRSLDLAGPEAYCTNWITIQKPAKSGAIILWQDVFDGPVMLISSTNSNVLLCLYDFDVDVRLFRIDTLKQFTPLPPSSDINRILFSCTWDIRYGTGDDWQEVSNYLRAASVADFRKHLIGGSLRFKIGASQNNVIDSLKYANMNQ